MIDVIEHIIKLYIIFVLPLIIILWPIGRRFKDLNEKIIELEDKINQLEIRKD